MKTIKVQGKELRVGDTMRVWWGKQNGMGYDSITRIEPLTEVEVKGKHKKNMATPTKGKFLAFFNASTIGMTIDSAETYDIVEKKSLRS